MSPTDELDERPRVMALMRRAIVLVYTTRPRLTVLIGLLTVAAAVAPALSAWVGRWVIDSTTHAAAGLSAPTSALGWVAIEGAVVIGMAGVTRILGVLRTLLRLPLAHRIHRLILDKALGAELLQLEDATFNDRLTRAQREAGTRPLAAAARVFGLGQAAVGFAVAAVMLAQLGPWVVVVLAVGTLPAVISEARFARVGFRLVHGRTPEARESQYLRTILSREDYAKDVALYELAPHLLARYDELFDRVFQEDRALAIRRTAWSYGLGLLGTVTFFGLYAHVAWRAATAEITIGQMTMFLMLIRQGQNAVMSILTSVTGSYADALYLGNLFRFLDAPLMHTAGSATRGPDPARGVEMRDVSFCYPGSDRPAIEGVCLKLPPERTLAIVGDNGSGKTTLVKLLTGLYAPTHGDVSVDGRPVEQWSPVALRRRFSVVMQDFKRFQFTAGHNVGIGDVHQLDDEVAWERAARCGGADALIRDLPDGYRTQLGRWFQDGVELSGGQWQRVALSRAFMRADAGTIILDEPTAALDPQAEAQVFASMRAAAAGKSLVLISHRFSSVREADEIIVLERGRVVERGTHETLMADATRYRAMFERQARGYR